MFKEIVEQSQYITKIVKALNVSRKKLVVILIPYYSVTLLNAVLEGCGMVLLVGLFTAGTGQIQQDGFISYIFSSLNFFGIKPDFPAIVPFLLGLYIFNFITRFGLTLFDGYLSAVTRQKMQELMLKRYLYGAWSEMRNFKVGDAVGTTTQEAVVVSKYLLSIVSSLFYILSALVTAVLALMTSWNIALGFGVIAVPVFVLMKMTFKYQSRCSKSSAELRNVFSSNITDRFNGLLQIHVDNNYEFHTSQALKVQNELTRLDIRIGACQAIISSFNLLMPIVALVGFLLFSFFFPGKIETNMALVASVGILGVRVASQLNGAIASLGNLSRLSGSLFPVLRAINIPRIAQRDRVLNSIKYIELKNVSYDYHGNEVLKNINLTIEKNHPVVLMGRSGSGKTTLANLIAGLYQPSQGTIEYIDDNNNKFYSDKFSTNIGFVTQDIYLFHETLRTNLTAGRNIDDDKIWKVLSRVDASEFVKSLGGLDVESAEAGRSLSGGQRRRLGIARVLLSGSEVLIFDEITSGLDSVNEKLVLDVVEKLSSEFIVVLISHDELNLKNQVTYRV